MTIKEAIRNDFLKHLFFEFSNNIFTDDGLSLINENKEIIFEERGIFPNSDENLDNIANALEKDEYFLQKEWNNCGFDKICLAIQQIEYFLMWAEEISYLNQIREEIKKYADTMFSSQDAYNILSEKTMFREYITIGEYINYFLNLEDKEKQEIALNEWNRISKNKVENFYVLKQNAKNKYLKRLQILERKLSIIAEEVFTENGPKRLVSFTLPKKI